MPRKKRVFLNYCEGKLLYWEQNVTFFFSLKFSVPFLLEEKFHRNFRLIVRGQNLHNYHLKRLFTAINLEQYNLFNIL